MGDQAVKEAGPNIKWSSKRLEKGRIYIYMLNGTTSDMVTEAVRAALATEFPEGPDRSP